jgi:glycerol-3-phosphate dehydrogenase
VTPSQGVHLVVDADFLPGGQALLVPRTADGRVLFAVPWLGKVILGTTDTPRQDMPREPQAQDQEVEFILSEVGRYLVRPPTRQDVRSQWVGLRPLVRPDEEAATRAISREHTVQVSPSGLVSVTGGKWTTYRAMAEDVLATCVDHGLLDSGQASHSKGVTANLLLVGAKAGTSAEEGLSQPPGLHLYGAEAAAVQALPGADRVLAGGLTEAMVRFAAREEYARTVEDVLARRSRLLFLDARLALSLAGEVAALLRQETGADPREADFRALAAAYAPALSGLAATGA